MNTSPTVAILGVSADYHDAAAAVIIDGTVVAAAEEERFSRVKHDASLPVHAIEWCLSAAGLSADQLAGAVFYDKPLTTYERILSTHATAGPRGLPNLTSAVATWSRSKLWVAGRLERALAELGQTRTPITFAEHHQSHAAAAYYPSPFPSAAVLTFDGVGEWATTSIAHGSGSRLRVLEELRFPDSLGLLYSAFTAYCGFPVNDGEYRLMGLAPYGEPRFSDLLREHVLQIADDGSLRLEQRWFDYRVGSRMTHRRLHRLLGFPPRAPDEPLDQRHADLARSTQEILEDVTLRIAAHAHELTGERRVCLAGGVALNCVANSRLLADGPFDEVWIQPAAGDSGSALGAALWQWHQIQGRPRPDPGSVDAMSGAFLGPSFSDDEIAEWLKGERIPHRRCDSLADAAELAAKAIAGGATVGWFQGRMEFGPRALGHRSILADPRDSAIAARLNEVVKRRESFRPFAPSVLEEHAGDWFNIDRRSPYMLFTVPVTDATTRTSARCSFGARLSSVESAIPACTHVDGSARLQTVDAATNPEFRAVLEAFHRHTGCPVLLNTSFNGPGEPIVRTPADAYRCFASIGLDVLVLERCVVTAADGGCR